MNKMMRLCEVLIADFHANQNTIRYRPCKQELEPSAIFANDPAAGENGGGRECRAPTGRGHWGGRLRDLIYANPNQFTLRSASRRRTPAQRPGQTSRAGQRSAGGRDALLGQHSSVQNHHLQKRVEGPGGEMEQHR